MRRFSLRKLAAIHSELGREDEVRAEAAEMLAIGPGLSVEYYGQRLPFEEGVLQRHIDALRKAGQPEKSGSPAP